MEDVLKDMGAEYFEFDRNIILFLMEKKKYSHTRLARKLNVSNKTIQRLINGTTKRIRSDRLVALAKIFSVSTSDLLRPNSDSVRIRPTNRLVQNLISADLFQRVFAEVGWARYNELLRGIALEDLPNHQEVQVLRLLGVSYIYLGDPQSAKPYLESALCKARQLNENAALVEVFNWMAVLEEALGNLGKAVGHLEDAESHIGKSLSDHILADYHVIKGRVLLHCERFRESEFNIRRGLALALAAKKWSRDRTKISHFYSFLGWLYLRQREYLKAKNAFRRASEYSKKSGATKGVAISELALGVIGLMQSKRSQISSRTVFAASRFNGLSENTAMDVRYKQLMFVYKVITGDFEGAAKVLLCRKKIVENFPLYLAKVISDSLFLKKINKQYEFKIELTDSEVDKARENFKDNDLFASLETLDWIVDVPQISLTEFLKMYSLG